MGRLTETRTVNGVKQFRLIGDEGWLTFDDEAVRTSRLMTAVAELAKYEDANEDKRLVILPQKLMPPTRLVRYCCSILKETSCKNRCITTGVRWAESVARKKNRGVAESGRDLILMNDNDDKRRLVERCQLKARVIHNPIIDWTDDDVWDYIHAEHIPINPLYDCGFSRVGCIGCPMAGKRMREKEFAMWPKYKAMYIAAFGRMLEERERRGKLKGDFRWGNTAQEVFYWWMNYDILPGQTSLFREDEPP